MEHQDGLGDPVYDSDRIAGSTPPERGAESGNVVGRPAVKPGDDGFHEAAETPDADRRPFDPEEAVADGGSFDGLGVPVVEP